MGCCVYALKGSLFFPLFSDPGVSRAEEKESTRVQLCASSDGDDIFRTWQGAEGRRGKIE